MKALLTWMVLVTLAIASDCMGQVQLTQQQIAARIALAAQQPKPPIPTPPSPQVVANLKAAKLASMKLKPVAMVASTADMAAPMAMESFGGGGFAPLMGVNSELFIDTASDPETGTLPSWRDIRVEPRPTGNTVGLLIATNCPFELTRLEAEVTFDDITALTNTALEVGFYRNTNRFRCSQLEDPDFVAASDNDDEDQSQRLNYGLVDLGGGRWRFFADLPRYGWGTSRVLVLRTQVKDETMPMAHLSLSTCATAVPGVTAYTTDNTLHNMTQVAMPRVRVWRTMVPAQSQVSYETVLSNFEYSWVPGYQLGTSTNLAEPMVWTTSTGHSWQDVSDTTEGNRFFWSRPDPTND